jgi:hypothetical protein
VRELPDDAEAFAKEILAPLREEEATVIPDLTDRAMRRIHASITARECVELLTSVYLLGFCAPLLDLFATSLSAHRR